MARPKNPEIRGTEMRKARLRRGWTLRVLEARTSELGERVHSKNLSEYERCIVAPNPGRLFVIAKALDMTVDDLLAALPDN